MNKTVKKLNIFFDVGGVVVNHVSSIRKISNKLHIPEEETIAIFKKYADAVDIGKLSFSDFEIIFYEVLKPPLRLGVPLSESFVGNMIRIQETHNFMNELCGYTNIGILSNMSSVIFKLLKQKRLIPDIAYTTEIVSSEIGLIKPSREIFEYAANKMGLASKDIFFIDDTEINVKIAKSLGWNAFLFDTGNPTESIKKIKMQLPTIG